MAIKKEDLLKFLRVTEFAVKTIEDDSSADTQVRVLQLTQPIKAVSSIPTPE